MSWRQSSSCMEFSVLSGDAIIWILCLVVIPYWFDSDRKPNPMSWTQSMLYSCNTLVGSIVWNPEYRPAKRCRRIRHTTSLSLSAPKLNIFWVALWLAEYIAGMLLILCQHRCWSIGRIWHVVMLLARRSIWFCSRVVVCVVVFFSHYLLVRKQSDMLDIPFMMAAIWKTNCLWYCVPKKIGIEFSTMIEIGFVCLSGTVPCLHYWWSTFNYPIVVLLSSHFSV